MNLWERIKYFLFRLFYKIRYKGLLSALDIPKSTIVGKTYICRPIKVYSGDTFSVGMELNGYQYQYEKYLCKLFEYTCENKENKEMLEQKLNNYDPPLFNIKCCGIDIDGRILVIIEDIINKDNIGKWMRNETKKINNKFIIQAEIINEYSVIT